MTAEQIKAELIDQLQNYDDTMEKIQTGNDAGLFENNWDISEKIIHMKTSFITGIRTLVEHI